MYLLDVPKQIEYVKKKKPYFSQSKSLEGESSWVLQVLLRLLALSLSRLGI